MPALLQLPRLTRCLACLGLLYMATTAHAEPPNPADAPENKIAPESETSVKPTPPKPLVKKTSPTTYRIGIIEFNKKTREITLPASTNITDPGSVLEYLLVHANGEKIHESLLVTEADPTHVSLAFKLLNYKESQELFRQFNEDGTLGTTYPDVPADTRKAARFTIHITWKDKGKERTLPVTRWLKNRVTRRPMPPTPWVYNGSYIHRKQFKAKLTGCIFTIFADRGSIANYPGDDRDDDTLWFPSPWVPAQGTPVTVTIKPWNGGQLPPPSHP